MSDFYSVLAQRIEEIQRNPAESRWVVYELARSTLRKQVYMAYPSLTREQIQDQFSALEEAINRIEAVAAQEDERRRPAPQPAVASDQPPFAQPVEPPGARPDEPIMRADGPPILRPDEQFIAQSHEPPVVQFHEPHIAKPDAAEPDAAEPEEFDTLDPWDDLPARRGELVLAPTRLVDQGAAFAPVASAYYRGPGSIQTIDFSQPPPIEPQAAPRKRLLSMLGGTLQITIASVAAVAIYAAVSGRFGEPAKPPGAGAERATADMPATFAERVPAAAAPVAAAPAPAAKPPYPLPAMYGVYAIVDDQLVPLEQVSTGPVDPRTRSTLQISKPSRTSLSDGKLTFILYRRDLLMSAPEKIPVRIAAKITRTMNFDSNGKAVITTPPNDIWLIRDVGFDLRVLPVRESQEMIYVRPENSDFVFPSGRYVLMFNGQPYDFTVEGPITDPQQCVEGFATVRGPAFNECRPQSG
jgi:hypothetical protein